MADSTVWWLVAGAAVALELATGTFYLLMVALGLLAGALAAHVGVSLAAQFVVAAVIGGGAVFAFYVQTRRRRRRSAAAAGSNADVNPDVGETVHVEAWNPDGTASVRHRGATWAAVAAPGSGGATGAHRVSQVVGNRLVLEKI